MSAVYLPVLARINPNCALCQQKMNDSGCGIMMGLGVVNDCTDFGCPFQISVRLLASAHPTERFLRGF